ncbi:dihydroorotate dehydrogenase [Desulfuribacillus alkaliarsenatis]|uniref:Dihydroorotate dehydrogenase n=1 Tax=Desulfuribacillus alkaliarsenatis TaxID=766136 RepID=A0A1E5FZP1_9FIRM|nr:dihydroorotate dehydrogenase [Desulfuribacillus alkaliarsenatis]OEF96047.1 dihydroorotate dehydrogenase B catalytic subunit [Desulfuribacillus alkaliarsenatis]
MIKQNPSLAVNLGFMQLKNPVMPASGCFGFGKEYAKYYDLNKLGAIVVKATTASERIGNPVPRIAETPAGMLNAIGLQNPGVDVVLQSELPWLEQFKTTPVIVNIAGSTLEDYIEVTKRLNESESIQALEVNISCPNVKAGGLAFGTDCQMADKVISEVKKVSRFPIIAKLTPNVTDVVSIAKAVEDAGADAVSLINTLLGMSIDIHSKKPILANVMGGMSGPAIKPVAVRMVWQVSSAVKIPVIGIGGITTGADAIEFILAGAKAVQVGTANFINPYACVDIISEIEEYMVKHSISDIQTLVGKAKESING